VFDAYSDDIKRLVLASEIKAGGGKEVLVDGRSIKLSVVK
jgi:hypothetical protein